MTTPTTTLAEEYHTLRRRIGTQTEAARALSAYGEGHSVHQVTISRRESGEYPISGEALLAMRWLAEHLGNLEEVSGG
jgi:hypothetical protein